MTYKPDLDKVSETDTTADVLFNKLVAGDNVIIEQDNVGANETLTISATAASSPSPAPGATYHVTQLDDGGTNFKLVTPTAPAAADWIEQVSISKYTHHEPTLLLTDLSIVGKFVMDLNYDAGVNVPPGTWKFTFNIANEITGDVNSWIRIDVMKVNLFDVGWSPVPLFNFSVYATVPYVEITPIVKEIAQPNIYIEPDHQIVVIARSYTDGPIAGYVGVQWQDIATSFDATIEMPDVHGAGTGSASAFTDLTDTFADYTGLGGQYIKVKSTEDGLETGSPSGGSALGWFNVLDYGAVGDGSHDDTADIDAAIAAIPATGGVLYFPVVADHYKSSGNHLIDKPITIRGEFAGTNNYIECTSTTNSLFLVSASRCRIEHIVLLNSGTCTAGAAITQTAGDLNFYDDFFVYGFWDGIHITGGTIYGITRFYINSTANCGIYIQNVAQPDGGDSFIDNGVISQNLYHAPCGIEYVSGGGLKVTNVKFNANMGGGFYYDYSFLVDSIYSTSILEISNCSFENFGVYGFAHNQGGGEWVSVILNACQFGSYSGTSTSALYAEAHDGGSIKNMIIANCSFRGWGSHAMLLTDITRVTLVGNIFMNYDDLYLQSGCTGFVDLNANGAGSGDVVGPSGATDGNLAVFDGSTGKLLRDGGAPSSGGGNVSDSGSTTAGHLAVWNGTDDHTLVDGGAVPDGGGEGSGSQIFPQRGGEWIGEFSILSGCGGSLATDATVTSQFYQAYWYQTTAANADSIQCSTVLKAGSYNFSLLGSKSNNTGITKCYIDDVLFATLDWYNSPQLFSQIQTGSFTATYDGRHIIKIVVDGKNGSSSAYYFVLTRAWWVATTESAES